MDLVVKPPYFNLLRARLRGKYLLIAGLLMSNLLLIGLVCYLQLFQKVEVTPFFGASYQKNMFSTDAQYLSMMTENFIYARVNVTPETVRGNHKRLLSFVQMGYYPTLLEALNKEARIVSSKKLSGFFEIKSIQCDTKALSCRVIGKQFQATKTHAFRSQPASYELDYQYHLGRLLLTGFTHLEDGSRQ